MWGTQRSTQRSERRKRFIPTHVGNSTTTSPGANPSPVHPHACGELWIYCGTNKFSTGSSPRMWGTPRRYQGHTRGIRFIPTHVGNSCGGDWQDDRGTVHPHACGELRERCFHHSTFSGSSPRMWGTLGEIDPVALGGRFIPTHVGNSCGPSCRKRQVPVHPHACGELIVRDEITGAYTGSSPRMWGTLRVVVERCLGYRFIPTHVGNSGPWDLMIAFVPVHPHACGELVLRHGTFI